LGGGEPVIGKLTPNVNMQAVRNGGVSFYSNIVFRNVRLC